MDKEFTIKIKMRDRWIPEFLGMLKTMQKLGGIGASRTVMFFSDGDGDFRPQFKFDIEVEPNIKGFTRNSDGIITSVQNNMMFDAG